MGQHFKDLSGFYSLVKSLSNVPSVVGYEYPLLEHLLRIFDSPYVGMYDDETFPYMYFLPNSKPKVVLSAHIDRAGFYALDKDKVVYGIDMWSSEFELYYAKQKFKNETVCWFDPESYKIKSRGRLLGGEVDESAIRVSNRKVYGKVIYDVLWYDSLPSKGIPVMFDSKVQISKHRGMVYGLLDNVISLSVLLDLYLNHPAYFEKGIGIIFTTKEKKGESWREIKHFYEEILGDDIPIIALDTYGVNADTFKSGWKEIKNGCVVIREQDHYSLYSKEVVKTLHVALKKGGIEHKIARDKKGSTEIGPLLRYTPLRGASFHIPVLYSHTPCEIASLNGVVNYKKGIMHIIEYFLKYSS